MNKKAIQKKLSLAIVSSAVVMSLSACKTPKQQSNMQVINLSSNAKFVFNKKGESTVKNKQKISEEEFQNLIGFGGFMWVSTHIVLENGHLDTQDYYRSLLGHSPINY